MTSYFAVGADGGLRNIRAMDYDNGVEARTYRFTDTVSDTVSEPLVVRIVFILLQSNEHPPQFVETSEYNYPLNFLLLECDVHHRDTSHGLF